MLFSTASMADYSMLSKRKLENQQAGTPLAVDYLHLFGLAALMSALNYVLYFRLVKSIGASAAIRVEFAVTVVAVLVGALVLDEALTLSRVLGLLPMRRTGL